MLPLGDNIKRMLRKKKMSRRELGDLLGVCERSISRYIYGEREPNLSQLVKMSDIFGVSLDWLITGKESADREMSLPLRKYVLLVEGRCDLVDIKIEE
jgi:transcriptional regulator with XRE-family HTH domain